MLTLNIFPERKKLVLLYSRDDAHHGNAEPVVETKHALGALGRLAQAVPQATEVALARPHVGRKTGPCEVEGVHEAEATRASQTAGGDVDREEFGEVIFGADLMKPMRGGVGDCFQVNRGVQTFACCDMFCVRVAIEMW